MNNLLALIKIEFLKTLSSFNTNGKKARKMPILYFGMLVLILTIAMSCLYSFLIISPFIRANIDPTPAVSVFAGITSLFIFMSTMSQARGIYIGEDYEMLSSLPIKKRDIVASKVITLYFIELIFSTIILIPHAIMVVALTGNIQACLIAILLAFTLPIVPIAFAIIISLLITMATARFKAANLIFVFLYTISIVGISILSVVINRLGGTQAMSGFSTLGNILKWINPAYYFVELSFVDSKLYLLVYLGISLAVLVVSILFLVLLFDKLHEIVSSISMKKTYVRKDLKTKSQTRILLSLEFKRLFNSRIYFVNAVMGGIMGVLGSVVYLISLKQSMNGVSPEAIATMKLLYIPIFTVVACMIIGLGNPTTGSINIEGKTFWIMKSLPVDYRKYMRIKLLFSYIITIPSALIASTIAIIFYHESAIDIVFAYLIPLMYVILSALIGLIVAIKHPKLKWNNETEAVKNSASVVISMLINFICSIVLGGVIIILPLFFPSLTWLFYLINLLLVTIPIIPCYIYLNKKFPKMIWEIEDF